MIFTNLGVPMYLSYISQKDYIKFVKSVDLMEEKEHFNHHLLSTVHKDKLFSGAV